MPFWHRIVIAAAVLLVVTLLARLVDWWLGRKAVSPEVETRYRVTHWVEQPRGGHFAAMQEPGLFVDDVRAFFATLG